MRIATTWRRAGRAFRLLPMWVVDAVIGTLIVAAGALTHAGGAATGDVERDGWGWGLVLLATVPYFAGRRAPLAVFIVTGGAVTALMLAGYDAGALPLALLVGGYVVGALRPAPAVGTAAAVLGVLLFVLYVGGAPDFGAGELVSSGAAIGAAMLLGWTTQTRARHIAVLERNQNESALRAAADERLRIAQELHDVVGHSLGVIAVQAGVGRHVVDTDPAEAQRALEHISRISRSSLAEIRRLLGVLRTGDGTGYAPAPGLADLDRLTAEVAGAGLPVDVRVEGDLTEVPPGVALAAYRIVQEALTNSLRHAGAGHARVRLDSTAGALAIEVADDGCGPTAGALGGHGLVGMRERVAVYGGSLHTGAGPDGGFLVSAHLTYEPEPTT